MKCINARRLWRNLCETTVGCDSQGNDYSAPTALGLVALNNDLPFWPATVDERVAVAAFLKSWANDLEHGE